MAVNINVAFLIGAERYDVGSTLAVSDRRVLYVPPS